jgi:hypothetical protein
VRRRRDDRRVTDAARTTTSRQPSPSASLKRSRRRSTCTRRQIVKNAKALAAALSERGFDLVSGGTDNHLILIDLTNKGVAGKPAAQALDRARITTNYNTVPSIRANHSIRPASGSEPGGHDPRHDRGRDGMDCRVD